MYLKGDESGIDWYVKLKDSGAKETDFEEIRNELIGKFGTTFSEKDVITSVFNLLIIRFIEEKKSLFHLSGLYYNKAIFLQGINANPIQELKLANHTSLQHFKSQNIYAKVKIMSGECSECQKLDGKVYTIDEALKRMPIPCKKCTFKLFDQRHSFCRCIYVPE